MIQKMKDKKFWTEGLGSFVVAFAVALFFRWIFVEAYVIPSGSMLPSLLINDHIFVNKASYGVRIPFSKKWMVKFGGPERGEVAVFRNPENNVFYIKRVVGLPGDKVYYENGNLYVNDELVEKSVPEKRKSDWDWLKESDFEHSNAGPKENYAHWEEHLGDYTYSVLLPKDAFEGEFGPYEVPPNHYFVMGDNRINSEDSRRMKEAFRYIPYENLIGKAMFVWLSCDKSFSFIRVCNPLTIRGTRFFHTVH